jgi:hypothetical protein
MILDSEEQRELLLQIFRVINVPMAQIEKFYNLKVAVENAEIKKFSLDAPKHVNDSFEPGKDLINVLVTKESKVELNSEKRI